MSGTTRYAYVFLVMRGDNYIPGVVCAAESIKLTGSKHDIVCMVTIDVSKDGRYILQNAVDHVIEVPYITRQMELYKNWIDDSYTKWNVLNLTNYSKTLFIDADMLILNNIDHLFYMAAPAATFSTPWASQFENGSNFSLEDYPEIHGETVKCTTIMKHLQTGGYTFIASVVLLEPNTEVLQDFCNEIKKIQPFGLNNFSTPDEQSLAWYYTIRGINWTHIHQQYNFIIHKLSWLTQPGGNITVPHVLHYFSSKKPWLRNEPVNKSIWSTDKLWWYYLSHWAYRTKLSLDIPRFNDIHQPIYILFKKIDNIYFPWLHAYVKKYPKLFKLN
jgi:lipopolysaccharide biosynthesis glycosyltransferase